VKKLLLIQPGAFGDIFVCAPIAKWYYDKGYEVHWPVTQKFIPTLSYFDYVKPIILSEEVLHPDWLRSDVMKILPILDQYDKVLNLADRGPHPTAQRIGLENFEQCKYRLSEVPFTEKNNLIWKRNIKKEEELIKKLQIDVTKPYALVHNIDSRNESSILPKINIPIIQVTQVKDYNILDWYSIILNAKEIYCLESSIHQFIDGFITTLKSSNYLLKRPVTEEGCRFTVSSNWKLDYIGKNSIIRG
jgi:hypothetical protein